MQPIEIIVIVASALIVISVVTVAIIRKIKGKTGCDCSSCGGNCASCKAAAKKTKEPK